MPTLKFYDGTQWERVGGADVSAGYVPLAGGTISGDLLVDAADKWDAQVITNGTISANVYTGKFDGNIRYTGTRTIDFGGNVAGNAAAPVADTDAATKGYVDAALTGTPAAIAPALVSPWAIYGGSWGGPQYRKSNLGGTVVLEGLIKATATVTPGTSSPVLFTLPVGYRPHGQMAFLVMGGVNTLYSMNIFADGRLQLYSGAAIAANGWVSLNGVRFPAK